MRFTYLTRFWVHSRSRFVSRATLSPSEKLARTPFKRRCASACSSMSSCCFAFNWPDLWFEFCYLGVSSMLVLKFVATQWNRRPQHKLGLHHRKYSRLCLHCQSSVQRSRIKCVLHAVVQNVDHVNSGKRARTGFIIAADAVAGSATTGSGAGIRNIWRRARQSRHGIKVEWSRSFGRDVHGNRRGLVLTLSGHCDVLI